MATAKFNVYTGEPAGGAVPTAAQLGLEPPRFCAECGRRMIVQVRPDGWSAKCSRHGALDSQGPGGAAMSMPKTVARHRAISTSRARRCAVVVGLALAGAASSSVRCGRGWRRRFTASIALTKSGDRVRGYLGDESDHLFLGGVPDGRAAVVAGRGGRGRRCGSGGRIAGR